MTRAANSLIWCLALLAGAVVGKKEEDPLAWAIATVAVVVGVVALAVVADERMKKD